MSKDIKIFVDYSGCGLANRMRNLIFFLAAIDSCPVEFRFAWHAIKQCPGRFDAIFKPIPEFEPISNGQYQRIKSDFTLVDGYSDPSCGATANRLSKWFFESFQVKIDVSTENLRKKAQRLILQPNIQREIENYFRKQQTESKTIGVHMRTTDFKRYYEKDGRHLPAIDDYFSSLIPYLDQGYLFYLACDDEEISAQFRRKFGSKILNREPKWRTNLYRKTSLEDSATDLYALAETDVIIGTPGSSFSRYASFLSGKQLIYPGSSVIIL